MDSCVAANLPGGQSIVCVLLRLPTATRPSPRHFLLTLSRLCAIRGARLWGCSGDRDHLLLHHFARRPFELVGQYRVHFYCRWQGHSIQRPSCSRIFWSFPGELELIMTRRPCISILKFRALLFAIYLPVYSFISCTCWAGDHRLLGTL